MKKKIVLKEFLINQEMKEQIKKKIILLIIVILERL